MIANHCLTCALSSLVSCFPLLLLSLLIFFILQLLYYPQARAWVLMSGFTLAFGSMFSKTYRVHAIFTNIKLNKKIIKDYKLFLVVAVLVCIDVATLTTWQIVDPFYRETSLGVALPSAQNEDILVVPEMEFCQSKRMTIFLGCIYVYKGLLMVIYSVVVCFPSSSISSVVILTIDKYDIQTFYLILVICQRQHFASFPYSLIYLLFLANAACMT